MNSPKTIMKQTVSKDIDLRRPPGTTDSAPGRKVGEDVHLEVTPDRVRVRAYEIFLTRNGEPGNPELDWLQAERELNGQPSSNAEADETPNDESVPEIRVRTESRQQGVPQTRGGL